MRDELIYECKDYADGWIQFRSKEEAEKYQRRTGCAMRSRLPFREYHYDSDGYCDNPGRGY